jgi:hypothetical protein
MAKVNAIAGARRLCGRDAVISHPMEGCTLMSSAQICDARPCNLVPGESTDRCPRHKEYRPDHERYGNPN